MSQRSQRRRRVHTDEDEYADGDTVLPEPWSPPPDPEFLTGTVPRLERADLSGGLPPGFEPSDSSMRTVRFSREELRALVSMRMPTPRSAAPVAAPAPAPAPTPAPEPVAEVQALAPRKLPRAAETDPGRPAWRLFGYHGPLLHLTIAFTLGLLTGILAMR